MTREKGNYTRTGGGTTVFDREELMKRMMEDEEIVKGVIERFLKETPQKLTLLKEALEDRDADQARIHAHSLKGTSSILSAQAMSETAFQVEIAAESRDIEKAIILFNDVLAQFEILKGIISD